MNDDDSPTDEDPDSPIRVLISYSHDSESHANKVLMLADRLRADGIDCRIDQFTPHPKEGWPVWMERQIRKADIVLCVCTERYKLRFDGEEEEGIGRGVAWEANLIRNALYNTPQANRKFFAVLFDHAAATTIPECMQQATQFSLDKLDLKSPGYESLYRMLSDQPETPITRLGKKKELPKRERRIDFEALDQEYDVAVVPPPLHSLKRRVALGVMIALVIALIGYLSIPDGTPQQLSYNRDGFLRLLERYVHTPDVAQEKLGGREIRLLGIMAAGVDQMSSELQLELIDNELTVINALLEKPGEGRQPVILKRMKSIIESKPALPPFTKIYLVPRDGVEYTGWLDAPVNLKGVIDKVDLASTMPLNIPGEANDTLIYDYWVVVIKDIHEFNPAADDESTSSAD